MGPKEITARTRVAARRALPEFFRHPVAHARIAALPEFARHPIARARIAALPEFARHRVARARIAARGRLLESARHQHGGGYPGALWRVALLFLSAIAVLACGSRSALSVDFDRDDGDSDPAVTSEGLPCAPGALGEKAPAPILDAGYGPGAIAVGSGFVWVAEWYFGARVFRIPLNGGAVQILADERPNPAAIVHHGGSAFWADTGLNCGNGSVSRADRNGRVRVLAESLQRPSSVAVDQHYVYVGDGPDGPCRTPGSILRLDHDGANPRVLAAGLERVTVLNVAGDRIFWGETSGRLGSLSITGGEPSSVLKGEKPITWVQAQGGFVYYFADGVVGRVPVTGGDSETLAAGLCAERLFVDDSGVFYTCRAFSAPPAARGLFHLDPASGTIVRLDAQANLTAVTSDAQRVYWVALENPAGSVWTLCKAAAL